MHKKEGRRNPFYPVLILPFCTACKGGPSFCAVPVRFHINSHFLHPSLEVFGSVPAFSAPIHFYKSGTISWTIPTYRMLLHSLMNKMANCDQHFWGPTLIKGKGLACQTTKLDESESETKL